MNKIQSLILDEKTNWLELNIVSIEVKKTEDKSQEVETLIHCESFGDSDEYIALLNQRLKYLGLTLEKEHLEIVAKQKASKKVPTKEEIEEFEKQKLIDELQTQLKSYRDYLSETSWIWDKYQRNCVILKNISEDSFNEAYKDIIEKQEFARNEIKRIEIQLGLTPKVSLDMAKQEKISELKVKRDFIIDSAIENVQVKKPTDRENIQGTIQYFEVLSQGNSTIGWTMEDNSVKELSKDDLQRVLDTYVVRKAQAFAEYQYNKQQVDGCMTIEELDSLKLN